MSATHITIDRKKADEAAKWARDNCAGYITNDYHMDGYNTYDSNKFDFIFDANAKDDIVMFALKFA